MSAEPPELSQTTIRSGDQTPRLSAPMEWVIRSVAVLSLAYSAYYLAWRWMSTLNPHALLLSIILAVAETWGFLTFALMTFTVWRLRRRTPLPAPPGRLVDVFITTYDEPVELLRRTAAAAKAIRYPHTTYLLDDGRRREVKALADELGISYIRRKDNKHAKAGNLNHALAHTDGEYILQLDADHVPLPDILDRLLGFLEDEKVAFVQTPQDFYNTDSFSHSVNRNRRRIYEEQRFFFLLIQPGKDRMNAAFFCGSCGIIRRKALDEIGGFSTDTITEDMETSMLLHARGWKSVYYGESLAYGLAPGSAMAFQVQRLRWGQGSMQILRKHNPLTMPGLTWAQKFSYLSSTLVYLDGLTYLALYLAPILFFAFGTFPLQVAPHAFLVRFIPYIVLTFAASMLMARGTNSPWRAAVYGMAKFAIYIMALTGLLRRPIGFKVTPKGATGVPFRVYAPQLAILVLSATVFVWSVIAAGYGWVDYSASGWGTVGWSLNLAWLLFNGATAAAALKMSLGMKQRRADYRFPERVPVDFAPADVAVAVAAQGVTQNINPTGMLLRTAETMELGARYRFRIPLQAEVIDVTGVAVSNEPVELAGMKLQAYGVQFDELPLSTVAAIDLHCSQHVVPKEFLRYRFRNPILERTAEWLANVRRSPREFLDLPVRVSAVASDGTESTSAAILEEYSARGFSLVLDQPVAPGTKLLLRLPYTRDRAEGEAVFCRALETGYGQQFVVGASCESDALPLRAPERSTVRVIKKLEDWMLSA